MNVFKKAAFALTAISMTVAPVAVSAADLRADTAVSGEAMGEGGGVSWLLLLLAGVAIIGGFVVLADGTDNSPTSP